jgi:dTDP-4-dehydrorhamnose reductase
MRILLTGAGGFVGWHTRARLRALIEHVVISVDRAGWADLPDLVADADAVIHVAGGNRLTAAQVERGESARLVEQGNLDLARSLAAAIRAAGSITRVVYANSTQSGNDTPYGRGKAGAADLLSAAAEAVGAAYVDVRMPNLFGEHGRPGYNSFVATFVDAVAKGVEPQIADRSVELLHVQDAAGLLIEGLTATERRLEPTVTPTTVRRVVDLLVSFGQTYAGGDIPPLTTKLEVDLVEHAFVHAAGGDLFIRKAPACTVETLARAVASLLGQEDPEIRAIGTRHGEKMHETLLSREELLKASDQGDYFKVPLDARSLEYELYYEEGERDVVDLEAYTSANTVQLEETKSLLLQLPEVQTLVEPRR